MKSAEERKEEFIKKAIEKYNNKYDYSKVKYINNRTKVCIICPIHGEFMQTPCDHLCGVAGCPECGRELAAKTRSLTTEEFIKRAKEMLREDELEDLMAMHSCYHSDLKGNGFLDSEMARVQQLEIRRDGGVL